MNARADALTLEDHAAISAEITEGPSPIARVLEARGISEPAWNEATTRVLRALADDVRAHGAAATLPLIYSDAFTRAQDALRALPDLDVEEWAALSALVEAAGDPRVALVARGLGLGDWLRLSRHWAARLASDPALRARFDATRTGS